MEVVVLSGDTTQSDLTQRKELVSGAQGAAEASGSSTRVEFADQAPVRAALHGRLLLLDGLEKAERNVLPTLNNLLENREMNLEDGRLLVSARRHRELLRARGPAEGAPAGLLVPTHPRFRVVALCQPAPPYPGRAVDPPLRSRFQVRRVDLPDADELCDDLAAAARADGRDDGDVAATLAAFGAAMATTAAADVASASSASSAGGGGGGRALVFPSHALSAAARTLARCPEEGARAVLSRAYPPAAATPPDARLEGVLGAGVAAASRRAFARACDALGIDGGGDGAAGDGAGPGERGADDPPSIERSADDPRAARLSFPPASSPAVVAVPCGPRALPTAETPRGRFVPTRGARRVLRALLQEHAAGRDALLLSPRGEGKSTVAGEFARALGYRCRG